MKLSETVTYLKLEGMSLCVTLCAPSDFGDRARFDVNTSHIFSQGVLASIIMVEDGAGESS